MVKYLLCLFLSLAFAGIILLMMINLHHRLLVIEDRLSLDIGGQCLKKKPW